MDSLSRVPRFFRFKQRRPLLTRDAFIILPHLFRPAHIFPLVLDPGPRHHHRFYKAHRHFPDFGSLLKPSAEFFFRDVFSVVRRAQVRLRLVETAERVTQEQDEFPLRPPTESLGDICRD